MSQQVHQFRAADLQALDGELHRSGHNRLIVRIDGKWRDVFDVWSRMSDDPASMFFRGDTLTAITKWIDNDFSLYVVVRYLVEEKSTDAEAQDAVHIFRAGELVEVQIPAPITLTLAAADVDNGE